MNDLERLMVSAGPIIHAFRSTLKYSSVGDVPATWIMRGHIADFVETYDKLKPHVLKQSTLKCRSCSSNQISDLEVCPPVHVCCDCGYQWRDDE